MYCCINSSIPYQSLTLDHDSHSSTLLGLGGGTEPEGAARGSQHAGRAAGVLQCLCVSLKAVWSCGAAWYNTASTDCVSLGLLRYN